MAESVINFPSQAVSDLEKLSEKYGLDVAKAIRQEWFNGAISKFDGNINNFHQLRLWDRVSSLLQDNPQHGYKIFLLA